MQYMQGLNEVDEVVKQVVSVEAHEAADHIEIESWDLDEGDDDQLDKEAIRKALERVRGVYPSVDQGEVFNSDTGAYMALSVVMARVAAVCKLGKKERAYVAASIKGKPAWSTAGVVDEAHDLREFASTDWISGYNLANTFWKRIEQPTKLEAQVAYEKVSREARDALEALVEGLMHDCSEAETAWLKHWMATQVLTPCRKTNQVVVLADDGGSGKSTLGEAIRFCLSGQAPDRQGLLVNTADEVLSDFFTGALKGRTFVQVDEVASKSGALVQRFKALNSGTQLAVNEKGVKQHLIDFRGDFMLCSNSDRPIVFESENRRFFYFRTSTKGQAAAKTIRKLLSASGWRFDAAVVGLVAKCRQWRSIEVSERLVQGGKTSGFNWMNKQVAADDETKLDTIAGMLDGKAAVSLYKLRSGDSMGDLKTITDSKLGSLLTQLGWSCEAFDYKGDDAETKQRLTEAFGKVRSIKAWVSPQASKQMKAGEGTKVAKLVAVLRGEQGDLDSPF